MGISNIVRDYIKLNKYLDDEADLNIYRTKTQIKGISSDIFITIIIISVISIIIQDGFL